MLEKKPIIVLDLYIKFAYLRKGSNDLDEMLY